MKKDIVVIGGGVIGLFSAYYLSESGHRVTVIDKGDLSSGCSYGNAGMIVPSHVIPLAAPGMISQGIKWMFDAKSPFYVRPRLSSELMSWGMKFYRSATKKHVEASMPVLRDLSLLSKSLYQTFSEENDSIFYKEKGLLMLYQTDQVGEEEIHAGEEAKRLGLDVDFLSKEEVSQLETGVGTNCIGGVHYKCDAHLYPNQLMEQLKQKLKENNVILRSNLAVSDVVMKGNNISGVIAGNETIHADEFVIAGGAWSPSLAKLFKQRLSILPGKGYSFTLSNPEQRPEIPSILCEGKVAVTPMGQDLRFGGTMEITHVRDTKIHRKRVEGIMDTIHSFYPTLSVTHPKEEDTWYGFRPCSPDGLPYIGRSDQFGNTIIATGHAMMGLSLGPATGHIVNSIVNESQSAVSIESFNPNR